MIEEEIIKRYKKEMISYIFIIENGYKYIILE